MESASQVYLTFQNINSLFEHWFCQVVQTKMEGKYNNKLGFAV